MSDSPFRNLKVTDGDVVFHPAFFAPADADRLFAALLETSAWKQEYLTFFGKDVAMPRLTAWYGDEGTAYTYSGLTNVPLPWTPALAEIKAAVEARTGDAFNSVLLNRYRDGRDGMGWHADDEPEFGDEPVIASVNFGAARTFQLKHRRRKDAKAAVELTHGSLLVMRGATQLNWLHRVPKTTREVGERVNLTFRLVKRPAAPRAATPPFARG